MRRVVRYLTIWSSGEHEEEYVNGLGCSKRNVNI